MTGQAGAVWLAGRWVPVLAQDIGDVRLEGDVLRASWGAYPLTWTPRLDVPVHIGGPP